MNPLQIYDSKIESSVLIGVDEVGRGPLAGPVVSAAVILSPKSTFTYLNDSKKLSESQRLIANQEIIAQAIKYSISVIDAEEIDRTNILIAAQQTMVNCVTELNETNATVLVDGHLKINISQKQHTIIKGDGISASIAAASILAKVYRDSLMKNYALEFPEYQFDKNKGYGSKAHRDAIVKHGPCRIHRQTFLKKILAENTQMSLF